MQDEHESFLAINAAFNERRAEAQLEQRFRYIIWTMGVLSAGAGIAALLLISGPAQAHDAMSVKGDPLGWIWPGECCNSAATSPTGDCAVIDASTVEEKADGYHITLRPGQHPRLKTKGYSAVIPYGMERNSPSGEYGICLGTDGSLRYCFFAGAKNW